VRQGLVIASLASKKILLYLKLPTEHLQMDKELAVSDVFCILLILAQLC
jgi:hypothetical protein